MENIKLNDKKILVCGNGLSGQAVFCKTKELSATPVYYEDGIDVKDYDLAVVSPSFSIKGDLYRKLMANSIPTYSEIDLAYLLYPRKMIGVTGTNGKTTTVKLVEGMLNSAKVDALAAGNIGIPLITSRIAEVTVCEISSFMLEQSSFIRCEYSAITNIEKDHLDRHGTFGEYERCKRKIYQLTLKGIALNAADKTKTREDLKKISYSSNKDSDVKVKDGKIYCYDEPIIKIEDIALKGNRNLQNVLCALSLCYLYKGYDTRYTDFLGEYSGEPYRMTYKGNIRGKEVYNDSKGTNVAATLAALKEIEGSVCLILGGYGKEEDYDLFFRSLDDRNIFYCVYGKNAKEISSYAEKYERPYKTYRTLDEATEKAFSVNCKTILFSPTTSSFDAFSSYMERGKYFDELLLKIK